jgi:hypothetical protein
VVFRSFRVLYFHSISPSAPPPFQTPFFFFLDSDSETWGSGSLGFRGRTGVIFWVSLDCFLAAGVGEVSVSFVSPSASSFPIVTNVLWRFRPISSLVLSLLSAS